MATSTRPTHIVQVAFDDGALVASPTWTTIPARSISVTRGRSDETSRFGPGTATVVVPNAGRLFDPTYAAGTYYGKLLPMRQLRVRATYNAVTYEVFRGHVEGWPQKYNESNRDAYVELVANDALTYLSNVDLPTWQALVPTISPPALWYPLDDNNDGEDFDTAHEIITGAHGVYAHDDINAFLDFSQEPLAPTGFSVNFDGGLAKLDHPAVRAVGADGTWSLGMVFSTTVGGTLFDAGTDQYMTGFGYASFAVTVGTDGGGVFAVWVGNVGVTAVVSVETQDFRDGQPHSVIVTSSTAGSNNVTIYVDGVAGSTDTFPLGNAGLPSSFYWPNCVGNTAPNIQTSLAPNPFFGRIDEVIFWPTTLTSTQAGLLGGAMIAWRGQTPALRAASLLDLAQWPSGLRDLDSDGPTLGAANLGSKLLSELQVVEASEQGRMFITQDGKFTLHSRWRDRENSSATSSQATFADDGADHKYLAKGFEYGYEIDRIVNHCTVTGADGLTYTAQDSTSITAYGLRSKSIQTQIRNLLELRNLAEFMVLRYKDPVLRAKQFSVNAERAPTTMWPALLGLEIGDRVTLQRTPQNVGSQISTVLLVERIQHDIDQDKWETRLLGSPVDPNTESATTHWVLGTSTFDSQTVLYF